MSIPVNFTTGYLNPDCFSSEQDRFEAYIAALTGEVSGNIQWQTSANPPSDPNIYWIQQYQGQTAPQTIFKWSQSDGAWTRIGEIPTFSGTSSGTGSAYVLTHTPPFTQNSTAYEIGKAYTFIANHASTGASTIQIDGLSVKGIKIDVTSDIVADTIHANEIVTVVYDGTNFQLFYKSPLHLVVSDIPHGTNGQTLRTRDNPTSSTVWETSVYCTAPAAYSSFPAGGSAASFSHGLTINGNAVCPVAFGARLVCINTDSATGYSSGDEVNLENSWDSNNESENAFQVWANSVSINVMLLPDYNGRIWVYHKNTGSAVNISSNPNWRLKTWAMV